jgi:hypothetical protein
MSGIRADVISDAAGTGPATLTDQWAAKVFCQFTGTGTVTVNASGNVSSVSDNGTGTYRVNYAAAFGDQLYVATLTFGDGTLDSVCSMAGQTTSKIDYLSYRIPTAVLIDAPSAHVEVTR